MNVLNLFDKLRRKRHQPKDISQSDDERRIIAEWIETLVEQKKEHEEESERIGKLLRALGSVVAPGGAQHLTPDGEGITKTSEPLISEIPEDDGLTPLERAEQKTILEYLLKNNWNQSRTSKQIGIRPNTMIVKMRKYGIKAPEDLTRPGRKPKLILAS